MTVIVVALAWSWRKVEVDPLTGAMSADPRDRGPGPADLTALEEALRLAERFGARLVAATAGPAGADAMLREALAAGADEALRVEPPSAEEDDRPGPASLITSSWQAVALARALRYRYGIPDLLLCGEPAAGQGTGAFPALLAAELNAEQALGATRIEPGGGPASFGLLVHRRLDSGHHEVLSLRGPAVVSVVAGPRSRRASLPAVLASQRAQIPVVRMPEPMPAPRPRLLSAGPFRPRATGIEGPAGPVRDRVLELTSAGQAGGGSEARRAPATIVGPLAPADAARTLLAYLRHHGYLSAG